MMIGVRLFAKITCALGVCAVVIDQVTADVATSVTRVEEDIQRCFTIRIGKTVQRNQTSLRPISPSLRSQL